MRQIKPILKEYAMGMAKVRLDAAHACNVSAREHMSRGDMYGYGKADRREALRWVQQAGKWRRIANGQPI